MLTGRLFGASCAYARVRCRGGRIEAVEPCAKDVDLPWIFPGWIDIHVHGARGLDFMADAPLTTIVEAMAAHGTACCLASTLSAAPHQLESALERIARLSEQKAAGTVVLGAHLEGPYLSPTYRGAQDPSALRDPDLVEVQGYVRRWPRLIKMVTIAPERPGALPLIGWLAEQGIVVALGHSDASLAQAQAAVAAGARHVTHLFNAMRPLHHRDPGLLALALLNPDLTLELIADGVHVDPQLVKALLDSPLAERIALVSDGMAGLGLADGSYRLGTLAVTVHDGAARLEDGTLAGSVASLGQTVARLLQEHGVNGDALAHGLSTVPARVLGLQRRKGRIEAGFDADFTVWDPVRHQVLEVIVEGRRIYQA